MAGLPLLVESEGAGDHLQPTKMPKEPQFVAQVNKRKQEIRLSGKPAASLSRRINGRHKVHSEYSNLLRVCTSLWIS